MKGLEFASDKASLFALATLLGVMIGAGIFGLPYVVARAGVIPSLFYFLVLGGATLLLHLFFGEVVLRTEGKHRLVGYAKKYLGDWGGVFIACSTILGTTGILLAYIILGGNFLEIIFFSLFGWSSFCWSLLFAGAGIFLVALGIKLISWVELLTNFTFFLTVLFILSLGWGRFDFQNLSLLNVEDIFLPYGVILFAFAGWTAIPEINEILKAPQERKNLARVIIGGGVIVIIFYALFALVLAGISGSGTTPQVFQGLIPLLGRRIIFLGALAGAITLIDSFLVMGLYLTNTLIHDCRLGKTPALFFSCGLPLTLFLIGLRGFIEVISLVGIIIGVIEGVVIVLIFKRAKKLGDRTPEYSLEVPSVFLYLLIGIFLIGGILHLFYFF